MATAAGAGGDAARGRIRALESAPLAAGAEHVARVVSALGDEDVEVRGEAFRLLVACGADIGRHVAPFLCSPSRAVRAHSALVLANRGDASLAGEVAQMARDESPAVRSSAAAALGHMAVRARPGRLPAAAAAAAAVRSCLGDQSIEVRRSALQAAVHLGMGLTGAERGALAAAADGEIDRLLALCDAAGGGSGRDGGGGGGSGGNDGNGGGPGGN